MKRKQIKSSKRVSDYGEVFTNACEVKAMCDMVEQECNRIDSRFLEPACGDGNFLAEIVYRKLCTVKKFHRRSVYDYERYSVLAISSIYGVDIMQDNVFECRERLYKIWYKEYKSICKKMCSEDTQKAVKYILSQNILCGNALTLMQVDENGKDTNIPIIFPEWSMIGTKFKRRDFRLDILLRVRENAEEPKQMTLFDDDISKYLMRNPKTGEYMALPIKEYPPVIFKKLSEKQ